METHKERLADVLATSPTAARRWGFLLATIRDMAQDIPWETDADVIETLVEELWDASEDLHYRYNSDHKYSLTYMGWVELEQQRKALRQGTKTATASATATV